MWICKWVSWRPSPHFFSFSFLDVIFFYINISQTCNSTSRPYKTYRSQHYFAFIHSRLIRHCLMTSWNWDFCHFCAQNEWKIVRRWHIQLTYLHIMYRVLKKCFMNIAGIQNGIIYLLVFYLILSKLSSVMNENSCSFFSNQLILNRIKLLK